MSGLAALLVFAVVIYFISEYWRGILFAVGAYFLVVIIVNLIKLANKSSKQNRNTMKLNNNNQNINQEPLISKGANKTSIVDGGYKKDNDISYEVDRNINEILDRRKIIKDTLESVDNEIYVIRHKWNGWNKSNKKELRYLETKKRELTNLLSTAVYTFNDANTNRFEYFKSAIKALDNWNVQCYSGTPKMNELIVPYDSIGDMEYIRFAIEPLCLKLQDSIFCFTPNSIVRFTTKGEYIETYHNKALHCLMSNYKYEEKIRHNSWTHTRVDGMPDNRYKHNPIREYYTTETKTLFNVLYIKIAEYKLIYDCENAVKQQVVFSLRDYSSNTSTPSIDSVYHSIRLLKLCSPENTLIKRIEDGLSGDLSVVEGFNEYLRNKEKRRQRNRIKKVIVAGGLCVCLLVLGTYRNDILKVVPFGGIDNSSSDNSIKGTVPSNNIDWVVPTVGNSNEDENQSKTVAPTTQMESIESETENQVYTNESTENAIIVESSEVPVPSITNNVNSDREETIKTTMTPSSTLNVDFYDDQEEIEASTILTPTESPNKNENENAPIVTRRVKAGEKINTTVPLSSVWGTSQGAFIAASGFELESGTFGNVAGLKRSTTNIETYTMDAFYLFGAKMASFNGLSKIVYVLSDPENYSKYELKQCKVDLIEKMKGVLGNPESESESVSTWNSDNYKIEIGTGKFQNYSNKEGLKVAIVVTGRNIDKGNGKTIIYKPSVVSNEQKQMIQYMYDPESRALRESDFISGLSSINGIKYMNTSNGIGVRSIQNALIKYGYLTGSSDGVYGSKTSEAVKKFQMQRGLKETGTMDLVTLYTFIRSNSSFIKKESCYIADAYGLTAVIWPLKAFFIGITDQSGNLQEGTYYYINGEYYTGEFSNNKRSGNGEAHFTNGDVYIGKFKDDQMNGEGIYYFGNTMAGTIYKGTMENNKMNGSGTYYTGGTEITGLWRENRHWRWK